MLGKGDFVFSLHYGIGVITDALGSKYTVKYENNIVKSEGIADFNIISNDVIEQINTGKYKDYFSITTLEKGEEYYFDGKITDLMIMDKNIYAKSKGTKEYSLSIILTSSSIRTKCTCPVGSLCKHSAGALFSIDNTIHKLVVNKVKSTVSSSKELEKIISLALTINPDLTQLKDVERIKEVSNLLNNNISSNEDLVSFINLMDSFRTETNIYKRVKELLIYIISLSNVLKVYAYRLNGINNKVSLKLLLDTSKSNVNDFSAYYPTEAYKGIIYSVVNNDYARYLYFVSKSKYNGIYFDQYFMNNFNDTMLKDITDDKDALRLISPSILVYMFKRSNIAGKKHLATSVNREFLSMKDIDCDIKDSLYFLPYVKDKKEVFRYVVDNYKLAKISDMKSLYGICYKLLQSGLTKLERNTIVTLIENDNNARYVLGLINEEMFYIDDTRLFSMIFDFDYKFEEVKEEFYQTYYVKLAKIPVLSITYNNSKIFNCETSFNSGMTDEIANITIKLLKLNDTYNNDYIDALKRHNLINKERKINEYLAAINSFDTGEAKLELLDSRFKVNIDYYFDLQYNYSYNDEHKYLLSLKVYIDGRKYIVKDINEFLNAIRDLKTIKYGKELEFNHRLDNFNDLEVKVLEYLLMIPMDKNNHNKSISLTDKMMEALFSLLKGRIIYFGEKSYQVRLDKKKVEISIDDNYVFNNDINRDSILIGSDTLYILEDGYVDKIAGEVEYLKLVKFTYDNKDMDVSLIKNTFVDKIYSKYYDVIKVNPLIDDEFKSSILRIDAYFDYVKGTIKCETKLYKDDYLITSDKLLSESDKNRLQVYLRYLDRLGFVNYELLSDSGKVLSFFRMDFSELRRVCNIYLSDSITAKKLSKFTAPVVRISYNNDIMGAFLEESNYTDEELFEIMKAIRLKKNYVLLSGDRIIEFDETALELYEAISNLKLDLKCLNKNQRINAYDSINALAYSKNVKLDEYVTKIIEEIKSFKTNKDIVIPEVNATLREYQKEGYRWLYTLSKYNLGGILADDMGLGKTLEMITLLKGDETQKPTLIICPKSLIFNWYSEINKFDGLTRAIMIYGTQKERQKVISKINNDIKIIYITAYDSLRNDLPYYEDKVFNYIILDEAQTIKNVNAIKSVSVKSLVGLKRFALTGTPIENSIIDLWSIFDFLMPGYLEELPLFKSKYLASEKYTDIIAIKIAPFILRRTKTEVLNDLPPKYEKIISCDMSNDQRLIYDAHIKDAQVKIKEGSEAFDLLPYLTRLREICIDPKLFIEEYASDSGKMIKLEEIVSEYHKEHKILIFSSFVKALDRCKEMLIKLNIKYFVLTGDTKPEERKRLVDEFNNDPSIKVFLISLKAGGTGLNLIGADTVIHLDPWWNLSAENQASDRAHRIGQTKTVEVIKLVAFDSLEERVIELQNIKKGIVDKVIANDDSKITNFSIDDLKYILG